MLTPACELSAFGPYAEDQITEKTGLGVQDRLTATLEALYELLWQLRATRAGYLSAQLATVNVNVNSRDLCIHIGCGSRPLRGWINIDTYPVQLAMSALWELPQPDTSVQYTFISRLPALLFFPVEIRRFLSEVRRVLTPGGILRIAAVESGTAGSSTRASREAEYRTWALGLADRTRITC